MQSDTDHILELGRQFGKSFPTSEILELRKNDIFLTWVSLVVGITGSFLLGFLFNLILTGRRRADALEAANEKLEIVIFDRKCAEERLLGSEERFRSAFRQAPHGMCLAALDGRLLQVNRTFCEMLGRSEQELLNASWPELTHPDDLAVSRAAMVRLMSGEVTCHEFERRYVGNLGTGYGRVKISLPVTTRESCPTSSRMSKTKRAEGRPNSLCASGRSTSGMLLSTLRSVWPWPRVMAGCCRSMQRHAASSAIPKKNCSL